MEIFVLLVRNNTLKIEKAEFVTFYWDIIIFPHWTVDSNRGGNLVAALDEFAKGEESISVPPWWELS